MIDKETGETKELQRNILEYFELGSGRQHRDKIAIVDGTSSCTFAELELFAKRFASILMRAADVINRPMAVFLPKSMQTVVADLGVIYSGNVYVNLDIKSPGQRIQNILRNIRPELVITSRSLSTKLASVGIDLACVVFVDDAFSDSIFYDDSELLLRRNLVIDTDPLNIINTSGSTGTPKGVALTHRGTIDFMDWVFETFEFAAGTRIGSLSPFYFDIYTLELIVCLAKGATLVLIPDETAMFPAKLVNFLAQQQISFIFWVPTIMVNISNQKLLGEFDLTALTLVFFAGEVFPMKHLNAWRQALPWAKFVNLYGPIEITVDCTYFILDRAFRDDEPLPIGYPCRNTDVLLLNENDQRCKCNETGELCVRGSSLALGYWNDPEKTATAFVQNPLNSAYPEVIYRTGDLVYRNERGELVFVGRKDYQIKHLGYRIELPEIENQVLAIEGIENACVLYNRDTKEITLFYESKANLSAAAIRQKLAAIFPKYMLPSAFHLLEEMPRNPNGKIDRIGLEKQLKVAQ